MTERSFSPITGRRCRMRDDTVKAET